MPNIMCLNVLVLYWTLLDQNVYITVPKMKYFISNAPNFGKYPIIRIFDYPNEVRSLLIRIIGVLLYLYAIITEHRLNK